MFLHILVYKMTSITKLATSIIRRDAHDRNSGFVVRTLVKDMVPLSFKRKKKHKGSQIR